MVGARLKISTLTAIAALTASAAQGADYSPPMPPPIIIQQPVIEEFSSWYLRGDIGFSNQSVGSLFNENYGRFDSVQNTYKDFDAAPFFGLGIGYNFNNWLRFDATGEYRASANFKGQDIGCVSTQAPTCQPDVYTASKSEWTFLLNGYVDLGTWERLTPFVGAGVGVSRNTIRNFSDLNPIPNAVATSGPVSKWSFAWALYAGVGYKLTKNVTIELAYRYIDLGSATTGPMVGFCCGSIDTPFEFRHLTSQDLKLGLRFNFDAFVAAPQPIYYQPPPIYQPPPPLHSRG